MISQSWINECLNILSRANNIRELNTCRMKKWKKDYSGDTLLEKINIKRGIVLGSRRPL